MIGLVLSMGSLPPEPYCAPNDDGSMWFCLGVAATVLLFLVLRHIFKP